MISSVNNGSWANIPKVVIIHTFRVGLTPIEWGRLQRVCKTFKSIISSPEFQQDWKSGLQMMIPYSYNRFKRIPLKIDWHNIYVQEARREFRIQKAHHEFKVCSHDGNEKLIAWIKLLIERDERSENHSPLDNLSLCNPEWKSDRRVAIEHLKREDIKKQSPEIIYLLGKLIYNTNFLDTEVFTLFQSAAKQQYIDAYVMLGRCYITGRGVQVERTIAFEHFKMAAEQENLRAHYYLGVCYEMQIELLKAAQNYKYAADRGIVLAQYRLACLYLNGGGVEADEALAFHYCKLAADHGYPEAQCLLARFYLKGYGVRKDYHQAILYLKFAANDDHSSEELVKDYDVNSKIKEIVFHCQRAVNRKIVEAQFLLAGLYFEGWDIEKDDAQAFICLNVAAESEHVGAKYELAICYATGRGTKQSVEKSNQYNIATSFYKDIKRV